MPAPSVIADLVERFEQQGEAYKSGQYNEAQLRKEFIDLRIGRVDLALKIRFGVFVPNAFGVNNLGPFSDQARRAEHPFSR